MIGFLPFALTADTDTSLSWFTFVVSCSFSCENVTIEKKEKKANEEIMPVYDLDAKGWRSFRWDSIKQVRFEL